MSKKISSAKRDRIKAKTGDRCAYCGCFLSTETRQFDHIIPKCFGGNNNDSNLFVACVSCNTSKGKRSIERYRLACMCRTAIAEAGFSVNQLLYLKSKGVLDPLMDFDSFEFFFESIRDEVAA